MNLFALAGLSLSIFCFVLAIIVIWFARNPTQRIWSAFNIVVALWGFGTFLAGISKTPEEAIFNWKLTYLPGTFVAIVFYHLICSFCNVKDKKVLAFTYLQGLIFLPLIYFTDWFINPTIYVFDSFYYHKAIWLFNIWATLLCSIAFYTFYILFNHIKLSEGLPKAQASYLFWGMALGWAGGLTTLVPPYGIPLYPVWHFTICGYALIMTYAIFKHRLLDLQVVIKGSIIYSILLAILWIMYLIAVIIVEKFMQSTFGYRSTKASIFTAFLLGLLFFPLRNKIQKFIDKIFFKGSQFEIAEENRLLRREVASTDKLRAIAILASGMAHEIKNPLTPIKTFTEQLPKRLDNKEFLEKFSKIVGAEVDRIDNLVNQLLNFSKPSPLEMKNIDINQINQLIDDTLEFLSSELLKHQIKVDKNWGGQSHYGFMPIRLKSAKRSSIFASTPFKP
ncbi:MAG: hypothetical protein NUV91_07585 [Candidatus Omnitrophica bacterium]|nr:hypothetical protein [Candidatus Omnitrophota bacterium]